MRYIITIFWTLILGQAVGYLGGALNRQAYDFKTTLIVSVIAGIIIMVLGEFIMPNEKKAKADSTTPEAK